MKKFMSWNETLVEHSVVCDDVLIKEHRLYSAGCMVLCYTLVLKLLQAANWKLESLTS
jgi:hypothetical protein